MAGGPHSYILAIMKEEDLTRLTREIEHVISTPYVSSPYGLKSLVQNAAPHLLHQWSEIKPCQVHLLAVVLLEQLPRTRTLVAKFGCIQAVCDALLERDPNLLDQFLLRATDGEDEEDLNVCVSMLSCPLPENIPVPARVPAFVARLVRDITKNPCTVTIRPLYKVMKGLLHSPALISLLQDDLMAEFQHQGVQTLRTMDDPLPALLTLATFAQILRLYQARTNSEQPRWLAYIQGIFAGPQVAKALNYVMWSAVVACSESCSNGRTHEERAMILRLAIEICHGIDEEGKRVWMESKPVTLDKLRAKLRTEGLHRELEVTALTLLLTFSQSLDLPGVFDRMLPNHLFTMELQNMLNLVPEGVRDVLFDRMMTRSTDNENIHMFRCAITDLRLRGIVNAKSFNEIRVDQLIISAMRRCEKKLLSFLPTYLRDISVAHVELLQSYANNFPFSGEAATGCEESPICYCSFASQQSRLYLEISHCIHLITTIPRDDFPGDSSSQYKLVETLIPPNFFKKDGATKPKICSCPLTRLKEPKRVMRINSSVHNKTTTVSAAPEKKVDGASHDWRSKVANLLQEGNESSRETVVQQIEMICQDLENRCNRAREPLVTAIRERCDLRQRLKVSELHKQNLQALPRDSTESVSTLKKQLSESEAHAKDASSKVEYLTSLIDTVQNELNYTREDREGEIESIRYTARNRELDLMATVAERDDMLEELQAQRDSVFKKGLELKQTIDTASDQHKLEITTLRHDLASATAKYEEDLSVRDKRIKYLEKKVNSLRNERQTKSHEVSKAQLHINYLLELIGVNDKDEKNEDKGRSTATSSKTNTKEYGHGLSSPTPTEKGEVVHKNKSSEYAVSRQPLDVLDGNSSHNSSPSSAQKKLDAVVSTGDGDNNENDNDNGRVSGTSAAANPEIYFDISDFDDDDELLTSTNV